MLRHFYDRLLDGCGLLAGLVFGAMACLIALDVTLRAFAIGNLPWLNEVSEYALYAATFLAAPWVLAQGGHVRVDLVFEAVPSRVGRALDLLVSLVGLAISLVLVYFGLAAVLDSHHTHSLIVKTLVVPEWPLLAIIPAACLLLAVEFGVRLLGLREPDGDTAPSGL